MSDETPEDTPVALHAIEPEPVIGLELLTSGNRDKLEWLAQEYGIDMAACLNVAVSNEYRNVGGEAMLASGE